MSNPERYIVISTARALTIGLNESILMQVLSDASLLAYITNNWYEIDRSALSKMIPFWSEETINTTLDSLAAKNLIVIGTPSQPDRLRFNILEGRRARSTVKEDGMWGPSEEFYQELEALEIPRTFVDSKIEEFVTYWAGRSTPSNSWNTKFRSFILRCWRPEE